MWIQVGSTVWHNLDQAVSLREQQSEVLATFPNSTSSVTLRTFSTSAEAQAWIDDVLDNTRED